MMTRGVPAESVRMQLCNDGLSQSEIAQAVSEGWRAVSEEFRRECQYLLGTGCTLFAIGVVVFVATGGVLIALGCLGVGGGMMLGGLTWRSRALSAERAARSSGEGK
jgi:hypothetical protein